MQSSDAIRQHIFHPGSHSRPLTTTASSTPVRPTKRRLETSDDTDSHATLTEPPATKRTKMDAPIAADVTPLSAGAVETAIQTEPAPPVVMSTAPAANDLDKARDAIHYQFGLEILLKHDELRLVDQELAKCQVALEQLRRCHLIPYPVTCPTPEQMAALSSGKGPAVQPRPGEMVPEWAPPFGVVDGPYARHYAKWLIPDPKFDGMQPEWHPVMETVGRRTSAEGRTTRNSIVDFASLSKPRSGRGMSHHKLQSLSSGYPQPKEKAGPCVLKRSDGQTVKLVCIDCQRDNFSSTQGFINHCRIAHRRDFKSHEEAAVHCGHPIEPTDGAASAAAVAPVAAEEKEKASGPTSFAPTAHRRDFKSHEEAAVHCGHPIEPTDGAASAAAVAPAAAEEKEKASGPASFAPTASGLVHPFAQPQVITDQQAYAALHSRIEASLELYRQGKLPGVTSIPTTVPKVASGEAKKSDGGFVSARETPFLSSLMKKRKFQGDLGDIVRDAKEKISMDDLMSPAEDSEDAEHSFASTDGQPKETFAASRAPVMRVPARMVLSPAPTGPSTRPTSSKARSPQMGFASPTSMSDKDDDRKMLLLQDDDVDMDADMSPNTMVSNNAPSLVSDDGEYDDSDDGSSMSDVSDGAESVSDVAEINIDEDSEPRSLRHHRTSSGVVSGAVRLKKEESKHVTFVSPVNKSAKRARKV
ncbi:hypothetical protein HYQ45_018205 [Verticillium longisporum]|uniref:AHC1-like C2H2 zinc-finger domain-containing protein n=1 Tax=Verticillium longisporum TaxID=100787 RepID=A0A8I2Z1M5_VERLO|nr:hypothetical protein HYQ45_018205 [Verticillium longisporum]